MASPSEKLAEIHSNGSISFPYAQRGKRTIGFSELEKVTDP